MVFATFVHLTYALIRNDDKSAHQHKTCVMETRIFTLA